jgi:hypothetical protein
VDTNGLISGGAEPGKWSWNSALIIGANLDAEKLLNWQGASFLSLSHTARLVRLYAAKIGGGFRWDRFYLISRTAVAWRSTSAVLG